MVSTDVIVVRMFLNEAVSDNLRRVDSEDVILNEAFAAGLS